MRGERVVALLFAATFFVYASQRVEIMGRRVAMCGLLCVLSCAGESVVRDASSNRKPPNGDLNDRPPATCSTPALGPRQPRAEPTPEGRFAITRDLLSMGLVQTVALSDCNDDGLTDLAVISGGLAEVRVFAGREGDRFELVPDALPRTFANAGALADLDGDRRDELILGSNVVSVLRGEGGCHFSSGVTVSAESTEFARQVLVTDANLDGRADLSVTQNRAVSASHRLLLGRGDGTFDEFTPRAMHFEYQSHDPIFTGFSMFYEDVDGDGAMDLFALVDSGQGWFSWGVQPGEIEQSRDDCLGRLLANADAMGVAPIDFDRDGTMDWFITGVASRSRLLRPTGAHTVLDVARIAGVEGVGVDFAWGVYSFDADLDGWSDLIVQREGSSNGGDAPVDPGPVDLFLNRHDGTFASVGASVVGLSLRARGLSCGPLSPAGVVGCFAIPDDGGPVFMVNGLRARGRQALVRLRGTVSAFDATGARVSLDGASPPLVIAYTGQSSFGAEHMRVAQVPLGSSETATVTVRWPSGIEQRGVPVTAGRINEIVEPEAVTLSRRVVSADGVSTVEVSVDPTALGGGAVRIERTGGGAWVGDSAVDGARTRRVLCAPSQPGEARIAVSVGGRAMRVRPRVIFAPSS